MRYAALALLALTAAPLAAQDVAPLPAFMTGIWIQREGENWTEESWSAGNVRMLGASREGSGDVVKSRETLVIERSGDTLVLIAQPGEAPPVVFPMVHQDAASIEFASPAHDYPQRIRYWREGEALGAEISLMDGTRAVRWTYSARSD